MKKYFAIFFTFILLQNLKGQHFEWALSSHNISGSFKFSKIDKLGNLIVAGNIDGFAQNSSSGHESDRVYMYGTNDSVELEYIHKKPVIIASYSFDGKINWLRTVDNASVYGIDIDKNNNVIVLGESDGNCIFRGYIHPKIRSHEDYWISDDRTPFIYKIDQTGKPLSVFTETLSYIEEMHSFHIMQNGNYLIAGEFNNEPNDGGDDEEEDENGKIIKKKKKQKKVFKNLSNDFGAINYRHTFMVFNESFEIVDVRAIGNLSLYNSSNKEFAFLSNDASGFFYMEEDKKSNETFIAFADAKNKLQFTKSIGKNITVTSLKVTSNEIIISGNIVKSNLVQSSIVDTNTGKKSFIAVFNKNAELKWAKALQLNSIKSITTDNQRNIYFIAEEFLFNKIIIEKDTVGNLFGGDLYISSFNIEGNYRWTKISGIPETNGRLEYPQLLTDNCGNLYFSGQMLMQDLGLKYSDWDEALINGSGHGKMPIVAKLKNTISSKQFESKQPISSCVISPGLWKISVAPNPIKQNGVINYSITYDDKVSLMLYDITGKFIKTFFEKQETKNGAYTINISNLNIAKGLYILALRGTESKAYSKIIFE